MTRISTYTIGVIAALNVAMVACSSDPTGDSRGTADGGGAQPAAATQGESTLMVDTPEYVVKQAFPLDMELTSTVFNRIRRIPIEYTCTDNYYYPEAGFDFRYGEDKSPPLAWAGAPVGTVSFAIVVDDPDATTLEKGISSPRVHWVIWNIPADVTELNKHIATTTEVASIGPNTRQGRNDLKTVGWAGPCPPPNIQAVSSDTDSMLESGQKPHSYAFRVYALDIELDLAAGVSKNDLLQAMDGHILAGGELRGEYVNKILYK